MSADGPFQVETDGPSPMSWDEYAQIVRFEWASLLGRPVLKESEAQEFLEMHPCMVPGVDAFEGGEPGPLCSVLYTQPVIPSVPQRRVPDFMWLPTNSIRQWVVFVEIERPSKRWFTTGRNPQPTAEFTQARSQIESWITALDNPTNVQQFCELYGLVGRPVSVKYCLIYGRRAEFNEAPARAELRKALAPEATHLMTFDRLGPREDARDCICARLGSDGVIAARSIPSTIVLSPAYIAHQGLVRGRPEAVTASPHFSSERGSFIARRFGYWDQVLKCSLGPVPGLASTFDGE